MHLLNGIPCVVSQFYISVDFSILQLFRGGVSPLLITEVLEGFSPHSLVDLIMTKASPFSFALSASIWDPFM